MTANPPRLPSPQELRGEDGQPVPEGQWFIIHRPPNIHPTTANGDWHSYPHLSSSKQWREHVRPAVQAVAELLETRHGIYLECPIPGCNMQGAYADHVSSTSGWHYKHLWQGTKLLTDGEPLEIAKERAWEQVLIPGGAVRYNHLDWEVQMVRSSTPQLIEPPLPFNFGAASLQMPPSAAALSHPAASSREAAHQTWNSQPTMMSQVPADFGPAPAGSPGGRGAVFRLVDLEEPDTWYEICTRASFPTSNNGNWASLPHVCGGRDRWKEAMRERADHIGRILQAHGLQDYNCQLCDRSRGWEEHIPGPKHYKCVTDKLGEEMVEIAREQMWQEWNVRIQGVTGSVKFNHLDGEIHMIKKPVTDLVPMLQPSYMGMATSTASTMSAPPSITSNTGSSSSTRPPSFSELQPGTSIMVINPASHPTAVDGDWKAYPHLQSKTAWKLQMKEGAQTVNFLLNKHGIYPSTCLCGENVNGFEDHLLGEKHYKALAARMLDGVPLESMRDVYSVGWDVPAQCGRIEFNHFDGTVVMIRKCGPSGPAFGQQQPPAPGPPSQAPPPSRHPPGLDPATGSLPVRMPPPGPPPGAAYSPPVSDPGASRTNSEMPPPRRPPVCSPLDAEDLQNRPCSFQYQQDKKQCIAAHFKADSDAEAYLRGQWMHIKLLDMKKVLEDDLVLRGFRVKEYWGNAEHDVALRDIFPLQESLPSYKFQPGQSVFYNGYPWDRTYGQGPEQRPAELLERAMLENGRKAWKVQLAGKEQPEVVPLERIFTPSQAAPPEDCVVET